MNRRSTGLLAAASMLLALTCAPPAFATNVQIDKSANGVRINDPNTNLPMDMSDCTPVGVITTASTNAKSIKASPGSWCGGLAINPTAALAAVKFYNLATAPDCTSATGYVFTLLVPASTAGAGTPMNFAGSWATKFTVGIAWCVVAGSATPASTDSANAPIISIAGSYK